MSEPTEPTVSKRLKESDWLVIVALWERGEVTLSELSTKFSISKAALSQGLKRRGAVRGSKAHVATKKIQEKIESEKEKLIEDIYNFKKRFIGYGSYLSEMAVTTIREAAMPGGKGVANVRGELVSIFEATKTVSKIRDDLYHLYDMYDKDNSHQENFDFNIGVYSSDDIDDLRKAQEFLDADEIAAAAEDHARFGEEDEEVPDDYEGI